MLSGFPTLDLQKLSYFGGVSCVKMSAKDVTSYLSVFGQWKIHPILLPCLHLLYSTQLKTVSRRDSHTFQTYPKQGFHTLTAKHLNEDLQDFCANVY